MPAVLHEGESLDDLQNGFFIIQSENGFRYGIDAVLLSGFARVKPGENVLDMGTGTGILPILLAAKTQGESFTGLEIQPESADMAERSVAYNHLEDKIEQKEDEIEQAMNRMYIKQLLDNLSQQERIIIEMRYFQNQTQTIVAKKLGISQVQVSRMEKKILKKLRNEK